MHQGVSIHQFIMGWLAIALEAKPTFTFHLSILTLSNAFVNINNREIKSESGFSLYNKLKAMNYALLVHSFSSESYAIYSTFTS